MSAVLLRKLTFPSIHGGYMFLNGMRAVGETEAGDEGMKGLVLTGVQKLIFYARGETGKESGAFFLLKIGRNLVSAVIYNYGNI